MKNKFVATLLSVVTLTSLVACGPEATSSEPSSSLAPSTSEEVVVTHKVTLPGAVKGAYVTADKTVAIKDEKVTVTVALTDHTKYKLDVVKADGKVLTGTASKNDPNVITFNFLMPDKDVSLEVLTKEIVIPHKAHVVEVEANENVYFHGLASEANKDEMIRFKVSCKPGFDLKAVKVMAGETPVELTGDVNAGFMFKMPDSDVKVSAEALGNYYELKEDATKTKFHNDEYSTVNTIKEYKVGEAVYSAKDTNFFRAGSKVQLTIERNSDFVAPQYFLNGVEILPDSYTDVEKETANVTYTFVMPHGDAIIKSLLTERVINVKVNAPGFNTRIYTVNEETKEETPATTVQVSKPVRIELALPEGAEYKVGTVGYTYKAYEDESSYKVKDVTVDPEKFEGLSRNGLKFIDDKTLEFDVPYAKFAGDITINVTKLEPLYKAIEGKYVGLEFDRHSAGGFSKDMTFDRYGAIDSSNSYYVGEIESKVGDGEYKVIQDPDGWSPKHRTAFFEGNSMMMSYKGSDYSDSSSYYEDVFLLVKGYEASALKALTYKGEGFDICEFVTGEEGGYETVATFYMCSKDKKMASNLTIEYTSGAHVNEEGASFTVKKGTELLQTVVGKAA